MGHGFHTGRKKGLAGGLAVGGAVGGLVVGGIAAAIQAGKESREERNNKKDEVDGLLEESPRHNWLQVVHDGKVFWSAVKQHLGWELQQRGDSDYYRLISPKKVRVARGNRQEMFAYWDRNLHKMR